jgi:formylglycine-generating enzyme required for sulfatase activity
MHKLFIAIFFFMATAAQANNVLLTNISVSNNITNTGKVIEFDVSWENSWRTATTANWDGVWIFFKFKDNDGKWKHLNFTGTNVIMPAGVAYTIGDNPNVGVTGVGIFIYRSQNGFGTSTVLNARAGIQSQPGIFEIRGFAIEMVYVPQSGFFIGDGSLDPGNKIRPYREGTTTNPYFVNGIGSTITIGTATGQLNLNPNPGLPPANLTGYPTGYNAFWLMKYELSQGAYRDFLNTLTYTEQLARMTNPAAPAGTLLQTFPGYTLEIITPGINPGQPAVIGCDASGNNVYNESNDGEWKSMIGISWPDAAAYLDWAGLRPMTEMEYEKSCRGFLIAVPGEKAWGDSTVALTPHTHINPNNNNSSITNLSSTEGNFRCFETSQNEGPVRGGIFATPFSTRQSSGAGFFGAMELTGGQYELVVPTNCEAGRSFKDKLGDGQLTSNGYANTDYWPGINGNNDINIPNTIYNGVTGVIDAAGIVWKGGGSTTDFASLYYHFYVSTRLSAGGSYTGRATFFGIRGVR